MMRRGQTALIAVLVVVVGMVIAVSVASRSVTTVTISTQEEERSRSFSAAEAGIEDALRQNLSSVVGATIPTIAIGNSSVSYSVSRESDITTELEPGSMVSIDWTESDANNVQIDWAGDGCSSVMVGTEVGLSGGVRHSIDDNGSGQFADNGPLGDVRFVRIRFVGCLTRVTFTGAGGTLSFYQVDAVGESGDATSRVQVTRAEPAALGLLDFAVFSGGTIQ